MDIELALLKTDLFRQEKEVVSSILENLKDLQRDKEYKVSKNESSQSLLGELLKSYSEFPEISREWRSQSAFYNQEVLWKALMSGLKTTKYQVSCCNENAEDEMVAWLEVNKYVWADIPERRNFVFEKAMEDGLLKVMNLCTTNGLDLSEGSVVLSKNPWGPKTILGRADPKTIPALIESGMSPFQGSPSPWEEWFDSKNNRGKLDLMEMGCAMAYDSLLKESPNQVRDVWLILATRSTVPEINLFLKNAGKIGLWDLKDDNGKTTGMKLAEDGKLYKGIIPSIPSEEWLKRDNDGHTMTYYLLKNLQSKNESNTIMGQPPLNKLIVPLTPKEWSDLTKETMLSINEQPPHTKDYATPSFPLLKIPYTFNSVAEDNSQLTEYLRNLISSDKDIDNFAIAVLSAPTNYRNKSKHLVATPVELNEWHDAFKNAFPKDSDLWNNNEKLKDLGILMLWKAHSQESFDVCSRSVTNKNLQDWLSMGGSFSRAFEWTKELIDCELEKAESKKATLTQEQGDDFHLMSAISCTVDKLEARWTQDVMGDKYLGESENKMRQMFKEFESIEENHRLKIRALSGLKQSANKGLNAL